MSAPALRLRIATHAQSFKTQNNQTELSSKIKELEDNGKQYTLEYHLLENKQSYTHELKKCNLCTAEIYQILFGGHENLLNSKNELTGKCRHRARFKLGAG